MGKQIAQVGNYDPTTMGVESYDSEINGVEFTIIDTPGLCDDIPEKENDQKYIELIRSKATHIDSIWFVTRLDDPRYFGAGAEEVWLCDQAGRMSFYNQQEQLSKSLLVPDFPEQIRRRNQPTS
jgi:hypothetical protein